MNRVHKHTMSIETNIKSLDDQDELTNDRQFDMFELFYKLWQEKLTLLITVMISSVLAGAYAFLVTPVHKSSAFFVLAEQESVQAVNKLDLVLDRELSFDNKKLIQLFKHNMSARRFLEAFFLEHSLYDLYDSEIRSLGTEDIRYYEKMQDAFKDFIKDFGVETPRNNEDYSFSIHLELPLSKTEVQILLEDYVQFVQLETRKEVVSAIETELQTRIAQLNIKIDSKREIAKDLRSDRVAQLNEAIKVAKTLNIVEPRVVGAKASIKGVSNQGLPLYYLGYRLLEAEKMALLERESDDPFIIGLRDLQDSINLLESIDLSEQDFKVVSVDQAAGLGEKVKPKKTVILIVSGLFGLLLGVLIVLIKGVVARRKVRDAISSEY